MLLRYSNYHTLKQVFSHKTVGSLRDEHLIILFSDLMVTHAENVWLNNWFWIKLLFFFFWSMYQSSLSPDKNYQGG